MGVKVTLIAFPSDRFELIFNEFPTSAMLADAVANGAPSHFADLVEELETDNIEELASDYEAAGLLVLDSAVDGDRTGVATFEPVVIY